MAQVLNKASLLVETIATVYKTNITKPCINDSF